MSGEANETQIAEALKRYSERAFFVREALFHLFSLTHVMEKTKPEILKVRIKKLNMKILNLCAWTDDGFVKKICENLHLVFDFFFFGNRINDM